MVSSQWFQPKRVKLLLFLSVLVNICYLTTWLATPALSPAAVHVIYACDDQFPRRAQDEVAGRMLTGNDDDGHPVGPAAGHDGDEHMAEHTAPIHGSAQEHGHGEHHQHDAMLFMFNALVIGACVMHLGTVVHSMQQTVVLFVLGLLYSLIFEGLRFHKHAGVFGVSYVMWMDIDPHLLLFTLLPALLAGDAMTIDTSVAKRVCNQCLFLAGPGVLFNAFVVAGFLMWYLDWSFLLSLVTASILCATDPVAVVALLKELGASPVLTVQIQGESLLNDGTAIVLYMVAYDFLKGKSSNIFDIIMFLVKTALMAVALGAFIGYFFLTWIRLAANKFNHDSSMIQISLTICCAYWSFIIAEGVFKMSGVLATVTSSLVLAHHMWPHIVSPDSLHHVWHTIESLGNIIIFFLAGALTGNTMVHVEPIEFAKVLGIYVMLTLVRGLLIFSARPLLRLLNTDKNPVSRADALVMTWGGLRGAVGLAMAIQIRKDRAPNEDGVEQISNHDAQLVLFHVSFIAFLTTIINATTAPHLVHWLGITALPSEQMRLLRFIYEQLVTVSQDSHNPIEVTQSLSNMLDDIKEHIEEDKRRYKDMKASTRIRLETENYIGNDDLIANFRRALEQYKQVPEQDLQLLGEVPALGFSNADQMIELLKDSDVDLPMARVVNKTFLNMVQMNYWKLIEKGSLRPAAEETELLLTSVRVAISPMRIDLVDFDFIQQQLKKWGDENVEEWWKVFPDDDESDEEPELRAVTHIQTHIPKKGAPAEPQGFMESEGSERRLTTLSTIRMVVRSVVFNVTMAVFIAINSIYVAIEEAARSDDDDSGGWFAVEVMFSTIFTVEFILKFFDRRFKYFKKASNVFDFVLVLFGVVGVAMEISVDRSQTGSNEARVLKLSRVFRVLRFLRVFRLFHAKLSIDKEVSPEVGKHLQRILTLVCFAHSHLNSQMLLIKYFGVNGKIDEPEERELARCIIQSQLSVYRAINVAVREEKAMDKSLLEEIKLVNEKKTIAENLQSFVHHAYEEGAIEGREAESILEPLNREISACLSTLHDFTDGIWSNHSLMSRLSTAEPKKMGMRKDSRLGSQQTGGPDAGSADAELGREYDLS